MHYRAYCFDKEQHILAAADLDAMSDEDAIRQARTRLAGEPRGHGLQVWQAKRRVHQELIERPVPMEP